MKFAAVDTSVFIFISVSSTVSTIRREKKVTVSLLSPCKSDWEIFEKGGNVDYVVRRRGKK